MELRWKSGTSEEPVVGCCLGFGAWRRTGRVVARRNPDFRWEPEETEEVSKEDSTAAMNWTGSSEGQLA